MKIDPTGRVVAFTEKPKTTEARNPVRTDPEWMERHGIPSRGRAYLASMGIYLFGRQLLVDMLEHGNATDFGKEVFPQALETHRVQAHLFDDYWEDIGTIGAFHKANIDLTLDDPPFNFLSGDRPIFSRARNLGGSQVRGATIDHSLISGGCIIGKGAVIENSVIGVRSQIGDNVVIRNTYVMGGDFYETPPPVRGPVKGVPPVQIGIGAGSRIENAIIDKNAMIGRNVQIINRDKADEAPETSFAVIRDGIVVVPKNTTIPDNTMI
jgi:glucose-1-phosphate adenylyltransferase